MLNPESVKYVLSEIYVCVHKYIFNTFVKEYLVRKSFLFYFYYVNK